MHKALVEYLEGKRAFDGANLAGAVLEGSAFSDASFRGADLTGANLLHAHLERVDFTDAKMDGALLACAHLDRTKFVGASLVGAVFDDCHAPAADFSGACANRASLHAAVLPASNFSRAKFRGAEIGGTLLTRAVFAGTDFDGAILASTVLCEVDLSSICASRVVHGSNSIVDWKAILKSSHVPELERFLVATGMPAPIAKQLIDATQLLTKAEIRTMLQSTFISYGGPDEPFARRLYESLRGNDVTVFFFPESATPGERIHDEVYRKLQAHDRVLLVCSKASLARPGVLNEIQETLSREARDGGANYLLPITLDDYVYEEWGTVQPALKQRILDRVIADFRGIDSDPAKYLVQFSRLITSLSRGAR